MKGVRPGPTTVKYFRRVQTSARFWGGLGLAVLATVGSAVDHVARSTLGIYVGFTSLLIVVGMVQQTRRQFNAYSQGPKMEKALKVSMSRF